MFGLNLVVVILGTVSLGIAIADIFALRRSRITVSSASTVYISVSLLSLAVFFVYAANFSMIGELFSYLKYVSRGVGLHAEKSPTFFSLTNALVAGGIYFGQLGMLNICMIWLDVGRQQSRFRPLLKKYRLTVFFILAFFFVVYVVLLGFDLLPIIIYISIPGFFIILVGFSLGCYKMIHIYHTKSDMRKNSRTALRAESENPNYVDTEIGVIGLLGLDNGSNKKLSSHRLLRERKRAENFKRKIRNITNITITLTVFGFSGLLSLLVIVALSGQYDTPIVNITGFLLRWAWINFATCLLIALIYTHQQVYHLVGKKSVFLSSRASLLQPPTSQISTGSLRQKRSFGPKTPKKMDEILEDAELKEKFTEFVRSKYADEPLVFYDACSKYQELAENSREALKGKNVLLITLGSQIVENFVKEDSVKWVNISSDMRAELLKAYEERRFDVHTFDKAKLMAFELLKQNFYDQFVKMLKEQEEDDDDDDDFLFEEEHVNKIVHVDDVKLLNHDLRV